MYYAITHELLTSIGGWVLPEHMVESPAHVLSRTIMGMGDELSLELFTGLAYFSVLGLESLRGNAAHSRRAFKQNGLTPNRIVDKLRIPVTIAQREMVSSMIRLLYRGVTVGEILKIPTVATPIEVAINRLTTTATPEPMLGDYGDLQLD